MAIHHQPSDGALPSGIRRYQWAGTCSVYPHMYPQKNHTYQRPMITGTPAFSSNDPGSTKSEKKDALGRLFLCLRSNKYAASSAFTVFEEFLSSSRSGIPDGITARPVQIFGKPNQCLRTISCLLKTSASSIGSSRESLMCLGEQTRQDLSGV